MGLHLILGPPGAGKAGRAVAQLLSAAAAGQSAFLCVPGSVDRDRFQRELAGHSQGTLVGIEVGTFDQLVARLAGSPPVRRTDRTMERLIVRDALALAPGFGSARHWSGFVETARHHVDRLRRARVWGGAFLEQVEADLPGAGVADWRQLEEQVASLLRTRRLRDDAWFERRAAAALRRGESDLHRVVVYGFDVLPPSRVTLVDRMAQVTEVTVAMSWRPGRQVYERAARLRDQWRAAGAFVEELPPASVQVPLLGWLADECFEPAPSPSPQVAAESVALAPIELIECCGDLQEADEIVREVVALHAAGLAWDDIAVASANAARLGPVLLAACERAGVPVRLQSRRSAVEIPVGRAVHAVLDATERDNPMQLVGALRHDVTGAHQARLRAVELQLRGRRHHRELHVHDPLVLAAVPPELAQLIRRRAIAAEVPELLRAWFGSLRPATSGELDLLLGIAGLLDSLVLAAQDPAQVELADMVDAISRFMLPAPDRSDAGVAVIASIEDLQSVTFAGVVLHGLHLGGFQPHVEEERDAPAAGRDLLLLAITRARMALRVIRQSASSDGGVLAPAPAWTELRRLLPAAPLRRRSLSEVVVAPQDVRLGSELAPVIALELGRGTQLAGVAPRQVVDVEQYRRRSRAPKLNGPLGAELATLRRIAATSVERYAACSARWFIEQHLQARDPDDDRSRMIEGVLAHRLLQELAPVMLEEEPTFEQLLEHAHRCAAACVDTIDTTGILDPPRIARVCAHVADVLASEAAWQRPDRIEVERELGSEHERAIGPGLMIDDVEVVGRIDRIDHHGSQVVLHDYKFGSTDRPANRLLADNQLQLLMYWLALEQPGTPIEPIGGVYRAVTRAGKPSGVLTARLQELQMVGPRAGVLDDDARAELLERARAEVERAVRGLRAGVVEPLADPGLCPDHCRLQQICRVGEVPAS